MTKEEAMSEYCAAINEHTGPETKQRVRDAFANLRPFMEKGKLPADLVKLGNSKLRTN